MKKGRNDNHPKKGSSTRVQPIRSLEAIRTIKANLARQPRNLCLFTLGINTAYRANEILSLTVGQVAKLRAGDVLDVKQSKNKKYRSIVLNGVTVDAIKNWLEHHPCVDTPAAPLFISQRGTSQALSVPAVTNLVKKWSNQAELQGNYGSHSLRKTWGYHQRITNRASVALLMKAFGHATEAQTLKYLCILPLEVQDLYCDLEL